MFSFIVKGSFTVVGGIDPIQMGGIPSFRGIGIIEDTKKMLASCITAVISRIVSAEDVDDLVNLDATLVIQQNYTVMAMLREVEDCDTWKISRTKNGVTMDIATINIDVIDVEEKADACIAMPLSDLMPNAGLPSRNCAIPLDQIICNYLLENM